jgi:ABC-type sugar transport system substrate-binding protein
MARYILKRLKGEGRIAIVEAPGESQFQYPSAGDQQRIQDEIHNIKVVASVTANWRRDEAMNVPMIF